MTSQNGRNGKHRTSGNTCSRCQWVINARLKAHCAGKAVAPLLPVGPSFVSALSHPPSSPILAASMAKNRNPPTRGIRKPDMSAVSLQLCMQGRKDRHGPLKVGGVDSGTTPTEVLCMSKTATDWAKIGRRNDVVNGSGKLNWAVQPISVLETHQPTPHDLGCSGTPPPRCDLIDAMPQGGIAEERSQPRSAGPDPRGSATLLSSKPPTPDR
jgi:hypothetical protein